MNDCKESYFSSVTSDNFINLANYHENNNNHHQMSLAHKASFAEAVPFSNSCHYTINFEKSNTYPGQNYRHLLPPDDTRTILDLDNQSQQQQQANHPHLAHMSSVLEINTSSSESNSSKSSRTSTSSSSSNSVSPVHSIAGYKSVEKGK